MWLLESNTRKLILAAEREGYSPSSDQLAAFNAGADIADGSRILNITGDTATINVKGVLTNAPSFMAMLFGGGNTVYSEIVNAISIAENDENVKNITLDVDSPGGHIDGLFQAMEALQAADKPITGVVRNQAASAAYMLISQSDDIVAAHEAARVGSIGVVQTFFTDDDEVTITSSKAPKKRPDVNTDEGRSVVVEQLDALHDLFVSQIAQGRGVSVDTVNTDFGQGAMLLADTAKRKGMIDSIGGTLKKGTTGPAVTDHFEGAQASANKNKNRDKILKQDKEGGKSMDMIQLKAEHPALHAEVVAEGEAKERDRVLAHLKMGEAYGAMDTALKAVTEGSDFTHAITAEYMAAGAKKKDGDQRADDNIDLNVDNGDAAPDASTQADKVADGVDALLGIDTKGGK
jgi:ClpP class serine protease